MAALRAALLVVLLCALPVWAQAGLEVQGGGGVGPYRLGGSFARYKPSLGAPSRVVQSQVSSETHFYYYDRLGLMFFVKGDRLNGITVFSPRYATRQGLRVGRTRAEVEGVLGPPQSLRQAEVVYPEQGLGFTYDDSGRVTRLYVTEAEGRDLLKGDRSIRAGERIGGIQIGMPFGQVASQWGRPDQTGPLPSKPGRTLCLYQKQGILLIVFEGQVEGITSISPEYGAPQSLRVGSARRDVYRVYGPHPTLANGIEAYRSAGIGFTIENDRVTEITVLPPYP